MVNFKVIFLALVCLSFHYPADGNGCSWKNGENQPEVYWINMDKSVDRKVNMIRHLNEIGFKHYRIRGIKPHEIMIPEDVEKTWRTASCKLQTDFVPPPHSEIDSNHPLYGFSSITAALCGRGKGKNVPKELGCTASHLVAMRKAIYSNSKSRYALIVEDDVQFPFSVDFEAMAATAPVGFGILQLFNSNQGSMEGTWLQYVKDPKNLWMRRQAKRHFDFWSTCAYMIDRVVMKPVIDAVFYEENGWQQFKIIAGITSPCVPKECCRNNTEEDFIHTPPCVWAPRGYQADSFLYAMTTTYMLSMPLISNGLGGNQSTFHQDHVEMLHRGAFRRQRQYINTMLTGEVALPHFATPACPPLDVIAI